MFRTLVCQELCNYNMLQWGQGLLGDYRLRVAGRTLDIMIETYSIRPAENDHGLRRGWGRSLVYKLGASYIPLVKHKVSVFK